MSPSGIAQNWKLRCSTPTKSTVLNTSLTCMKGESCEKVKFDFLFLQIFKISLHTTQSWIRLAEKRSNLCLKSSGDAWVVGKLIFSKIIMDPRSSRITSSSLANTA